MASLAFMTERFAPGVTKQLGCHVYLLIDPRSRKPFYVGKGTGDRCSPALVKQVTADSGDFRWT